MPKSTNLYFTQNFKLTANVLVNANGTGIVNVFTAGTNDSVVKSLHAVSTDTAARTVNIYVHDGAQDIYIGSTQVAVAAGNNGTTATTDLLGGTLFPSLPYDANGKRVLPLPAGYVLRANSQVAITAGRSMTFVAMAEDY
jgi:hypothetical protein